MRIWLAILVTLGACKNHDLENLNAVRDAVCACKDASCADHAMARIEKSTIPSTPRTQAIAREITECRARIEAAERPTTDPDAEGNGDPEPSAAAPAPAGSAAAPAPPAAR